MRPFSLFLFTLVTVAVVPATVFAGPILVNNHGFEADFAADNTFPVFTPSDWEIYDPFGLHGGGDLVGVLNPTNSTFFPGGAPEGSNVALVWLDGQIGAGEYGLYQTLSDTLEPGVYTLRVWVGNIASGIGAPPFDQYGFYVLDGFPGYRVELVAGNTVIAVDDNQLTPTLGEGEFDETTLQVVIPSDDPLLGQPLEIRLINSNLQTPQDRGIEVDFDDIRLGHQATDSTGAMTAVDCIGGPDATTGPCPNTDYGCADLDLDGDVDITDLARLMPLIE